MNLKSVYCFAGAAFAALLAAGGLAGCFSERVSITPPTGQELCTGVAPPNVVRIQNFSFSPNVLNVARGTTVTFVNCEAGGIQHTSTSDTGLWNSNLLPQYTTFTRTFDAAGTFPFHCVPHPTMKGTVGVS
ncbi:MAG TPA: plastocyanin/azurin family copper-binding protein [Longimicrobium sp.]|nr:plastocyanin/azurin family copper-binding protein [Longimicrobium sp.]